MGRPEVGPAFAGEPLGLGAPPGRDFGVVAGGQHLRDRPALEHLRPGILRVFQQPVGEALVRAGGLLAHDAGDEPHAGVDQHHRGESRRPTARSRRSTPLRALRASIRRWSTPRTGRRRSTAPGAPRQRLDARLGQRRAARAHEQARPGVAAGAAASMARASTSARITMPGPPPAGVSSTERCLSVGMRADVAARRATTARPPAPCRRGCRRAGRETCPGNGQHGRAPHGQASSYEFTVAQFGADALDDLAELVLAGAFAALAPIVVVRGRFDDRLVAGREQQLLQRRVQFELRRTARYITSSLTASQSGRMRSRCLSARLLGDDRLLGLADLGLQLHGR